MLDNSQRLMRIIVAMDSNRGIGIEGRLPWHNRHELAHFKNLTQGCSLILGNSTFKTLPPLKDRLLFPVSKAGDSFEEAVRKALLSGRGKPWVIGGSQIYSLALPYCNEMHISIMDGFHACDSFFPKIGPEWEIVHTERKKGFDYHILAKASYFPI